MKTPPSKNRERGLTLLELLVVLAVITLFILMFISGAEFTKAKPRALRIQCVNNLKQIGLAERAWSDDNGGKYPMELSETNGGTKEFITGPNLFHHYLAMSNELSIPRVLICPAEETRMPATNFASLANSNISYFVNLDATNTDPQSIWSGDRNITNGTPIKNGILELTTNSPAGWTAELHNKVGNLALSDGSVQQVSTFGLSNAVVSSSAFTNRLQMPILGP